MSLQKQLLYMQSKFIHLNNRSINIKFKELLEQNNILYQQDKNCYLTNIGNIYISKKKDTNFYINSIFILPDSYYYIFYNGCKKYQPQWCFINEYSYLQLNHNYIFDIPIVQKHYQSNIKKVTSYTHRLNIEPYLKLSSKS